MDGLPLHRGSRRCGDAAHGRRRRLARTASRRGGACVRFGASIHAPEDEICLVVFGASSAVDVDWPQSGLDPLRVIEAVPSGKE